MSRDPLPRSEHTHQSLSSSRELLSKRAKYRLIGLSVLSADGNNDLMAMMSTSQS